MDCNKLEIRVFRLFFYFLFPLQTHNSNIRYTICLLKHFCCSDLTGKIFHHGGDCYFKYWLLCWLMSPLIIMFIKCQKIVKHSRYNFQESKVTSSCIIFCLSNNPKPKDHQFNIIWQRKTLNHHIWEAETDRKLLKRLISYQNSWLKIIIND